MFDGRRPVKVFVGALQMGITERAFLTHSAQRLGNNDAIYPSFATSANVERALILSSSSSSGEPAMCGSSGRRVREHEQAASRRFGRSTPFRSSHRGLLQHRDGCHEGPAGAVAFVRALGAQGVGTVRFGTAKAKSVAGLSDLLILGRPACRGVNSGCGARTRRWNGASLSPSSGWGSSRITGT